MAVFPESMDKLNLNDSKASLAIIENYIHYMVERIDFSTKNTTRAIGGASLSSPDVVLLLEGIANQISAMRSEISNLQSRVTALEKE